MNKSYSAVFDQNPISAICLKLNRYNLKTQYDIDKACTKILKSNNTESFFIYRITNDQVITFKNKHRNRLSKNAVAENITVVWDHFPGALFAGTNKNFFPIKLIRNNLAMAMENDKHNQ